MSSFPSNCAKEVNVIFAVELNVELLVEKRMELLNVILIACKSLTSVASSSEASVSIDCNESLFALIFFAMSELAVVPIAMSLRTPTNADLSDSLIVDVIVCVVVFLELEHAESIIAMQMPTMKLLLRNILIFIPTLNWNFVDSDFAERRDERICQSSVRDERNIEVYRVATNLVTVL